MGAALLRAALVAAAIGMGFVAPARAIEGAHALGGQLVPLPAGQWELLATSEENLTLAGPARTARMTGMAAALHRDGQVVAVVVARGNLTPVRAAFGLTEGCRRTDLYFHRNDTVRGWRDFDSIYHSVFACMRGSHGYPKGRAYGTVPEGLLLRPAIPSSEVFGQESTYGPKAISAAEPILIFFDTIAMPIVTSTRYQMLNTSK